MINTIGSPDHSDADSGGEVTRESHSR
jgi:hypothetical protein